MKKIIIHCLIALIQMSIVLSACGHEIPDTPNETSEHTSSIISSEASSEPEQSGVITAIPFDRNDYKANGQKALENPLDPSPITAIKRNQYYDYDNTGILKRWFWNKTHDYCICGSVCYDYNEYYDETLHQDPVGGSLIDDEVREAYIDRVWNMSMEELDYLPRIYHYFKDFGITEEEYRAAREEALKIHEKGLEGSDGGQIDSQLLTDRQIELLFGGYSEETIKKELKNKTTFYFEGKLYTSFELEYTVDDETFKRMMADENFYLYLFDNKEIISTVGILDRIEALSATE